MLAAREISFAHDARVLLDKASVTIDDGERAALVGRNGAGKSTLLNILAGRIEADGGVVERGRGQRVVLLSQTPDIDDARTIKDAVREKDTDEHRVEEVLTRLGVSDWGKSVGALSGGQRRRVDLARVLISIPPGAADVLLLDEPTNHLDGSGITFLANELSRHRGPIVMVSHDRAFIDDVGTRVVELMQGKLVPHPAPKERKVGEPGLYDAYLESKLIREEIDAQTQHRRSRLYVRELAWLRAGTPARTTKQRARIDRAGQLADDVETQAQALREQQSKVLLSMADSKRLGKTILNFKATELSRGSKKIVGAFDLAVTAGSRWGVVGDNGTGKTTMLLAVRTACGDDGLAADERITPSAGAIEIGQHTSVAVFDQMKQSVDDSMTLEEILGAGNDHIQIGEFRIHVATYLEQFLFEGSDRKRRAGTLSGGQKSRLVLARLFQQGKNVLLLDEPTNDLDIETLGVLEDALQKHTGCALVVSHDRRFLDRVCTGILAFEPQPDGTHRPVPYVGDHTNYLRAKKTDAAAALANNALTSTGARVKDVAKKKRSYKEEQELSGMEGALAKLEARRDEIRTQLNDPALYKADAAKAKALTAELTSLDHKVEQCYARWSELEMLPPM